MSIVNASSGLNINLVDFNDFADGDAVASSTQVIVTDVGGLSRGVFIGSGITFNASGVVTAGTVTGYQEQYKSGASWVTDWSIAGGTPVTAVSVYNAVVTVSNADDLAVLQSALAGADTVNLSNETDNVRTYAGNDKVYGKGGNDTIDGGLGNDTIDGGLGNDSMIGGAGSDVYVVNATTDIVVETSSLATDIDSVLSSVTRALGNNQEKLVLTGTLAINGTGNTLANTLTGNSGNNVLNGGTGNDTMAGGLGNDSYVVNAAGDVVVEGASAGTDTVLSAVSRTLGLNQEKLTLTGTAAISGTGNTQANTIVGNAAANLIAGGGGNDLLTGGLGSDLFRFNTTLSASANVDRISDFNAAADGLQLDDAFFAGIGPVGALAATAFRAGSAAGDSNDRVIYNSATGQLFFDSNGSAAGGSTLFATVAIGTSLTAADIFIV